MRSFSKLSFQGLYYREKQVVSTLSILSIKSGFVQIFFFSNKISGVASVKAQPANFLKKLKIPIRRAFNELNSENKGIN